jgi:hypothetical protein
MSDLPSYDYDTDSESEEIEVNNENAESIMNFINSLS